MSYKIQDCCFANFAHAYGFPWRLSFFSNTVAIKKRIAMHDFYALNAMLLKPATISLHVLNTKY